MPNNVFYYPNYAKVLLVKFLQKDTRIGLGFGVFFSEIYIPTYEAYHFINLLI